MAELVGEGKVRWAGVSNFDRELLERSEAIRHVDSLQPPLSLVDRRSRSELIPWCRENGTGVVVYSPMGSGLLSGAFSRERVESLPEDDWRRGAPRRPDQVDGWLPAGGLELSGAVLEEIERAVKETGAGEG
jgi:aryl-alcohol dehydrogenase-like predicted oxidoreductase